MMRLAFPLSLWLVAVTVIPSAYADSLDELSRKRPLLAEALRGDAGIRACLSTPDGRKAAARIAALASCPDPDVCAALDIICRPVPALREERKIVVNGEADDWRGVGTAALPDPSAAARELGTAMTYFAAYADTKRLYIAIRFADMSFPRLGGHAIRLQLDLIGTPALDWQVDIAGGTWTATCCRAGTEERTEAEDICIRCGDILEISLPLKALSGGQEIKPIIAVRASASVENWKRGRHRSDYAFAVYPAAKRDYYCRPYARSLFYLCHDADVQVDDLTALAVAIMRAVYWYVGDDDVREQARRDAAEVLQIAREIVAWQKERGVSPTLSESPIEALLAWASLGAERTNVGAFGMYRPDGPPNLDRYLWISLRPENLRRLRKMAEENGLVDADVSAMGDKIDKWAKEQQHYRVGLEEMKRRFDLGMLEKETYEEAVEEAKQGVDKWLKLAGDGVFYGTMNSANAVLKLYDKTGKFYGNCSDHTLFCAAMYSSVGIAPLRFFREPSRQKAINHVWPGYYNPVARRWQSPQKGKTKCRSCVYFITCPIPAHIDTFCLPPFRLRANDEREQREYGVQEVSRHLLTAMLRAGFDGGQVRERLLRPQRRFFLPRPAMPPLAVVAPDKGAIRVGVFADEKASQTCVRKTIAALNAVPDISATWFLAQDVGRGRLKDLDVLLFTGGSTRQCEVLGAEGCQAVREAVQQGKGYVGTGAGATMAAVSWNWCKPMSMIAAKTDTKFWNRGVGVAEMRTLPGPGQPVWIAYDNGCVFTPLAVDGLGKAVPLADYVTEFRENDAPEGSMRDHPGILAGDYGRGRVVLMGPHPQMFPNMRHLLPDAVRWAAKKGDDGPARGWDSVFGAKAARPQPIAPYLRVGHGRDADWHGVALGAPMATHDWWTGDMAVALNADYGIPIVGGFDMQTGYIGHLFDVSRPSERPFFYWRPREEPSYSADARSVYAAYQRALFDAAQTQPLDLYVELRGHSLKVEAAQESEGGEKKAPTYRQVVEAVATGFTDGEIQALKKQYARLLADHAPAVCAPIHFSNLAQDRTYVVDGRKVEFAHTPEATIETGAMRPSCAKRSLFLALPRAARFAGRERRKYVQIVAGLIQAARQTARQTPAPAPGPGNLVRNAGMERDVDGDWLKRTPDDESRTLRRTDRTAHSGTWSLSISNRAPTTSRWRQGGDRSIRVSPGSTLDVAGWIKTDLAPDSKAFLNVFLFSDGHVTIIARDTRPVSGTRDWTRVTNSFTVPDDVTHCAVYLELRGKGDAWFDDVVLHETPQSACEEVGPVTLITDLPDGDRTVAALTRLCPGRLSVVAPGEARKALTEGSGSAVVLLRGDAKDRRSAYGALKEFVRKGGTVVMDLGNFGELAKTKVEQALLAGLPTAAGTFDGASGAYRVNVLALDEPGFSSDLYLEVGGRVVGRWRLDAGLPGRKGRRRVRVLSVGPIRLKRGDAIRLAAGPAGRERCVVDRIEFVSSAGRVAVMEAEDMKLTGYAASDKPAPFDRAIETSRDRVQKRRLSVDVECDVTTGFRVGDTVPWCGGECRQVLAQLPKGVRSLAGVNGKPCIVEQTVGKGRIVAMDLLCQGEPVLGRPGTYNKYLFLGNVIGRGVDWGRFYAKKLTYADFVHAMRALALRYKGVRFVEEGPGSGGYTICSLNLGDRAKPAFLFCGAVHGTEWETAYGLLNFAEKVAASPSACGLDLERYSFKIVPILNPYGYDHRQRKNANDVDVNRNGDCGWAAYQYKGAGKEAAYDRRSTKWKGAAPFSEPEAQTYKKIIDTNRVHCVVDFHSLLHIISAPSTARPDNDAQPAAIRAAFQRRYRDRYVFGFPDGHGVRQYRLGRTQWMGEVPYLIQYGAKGHHGMLIETPGCYSGTYATVMQTEVVAAACMAAAEACGGLAP